MRTTILIHARILGCLALAASLCSCSLLIPENPSAPRYNKVLGAPRKPELNPSASGGDGQSMNHTTPTTPVAQNDPMPVGVDAQPHSSDIIANDVPPPVAQAPLQNDRQMPAENGSMTLAAGGGTYPTLTQAPPSPTDPQAIGRLNAIRTQLEGDRAAANADKDRLSNDVNAEPSLIGTTPPAPINASPQSMMTPNGAVALPPPPPPLMQANAAPSFAAPVYNANGAALEPITLHPPGTASTALPPPQLSYTPTLPTANVQAMAPASTDGFNPMASSGTYASNGYLPDSRYAHRYQ